MLFDFEERPSDSPLVERIWRTRNERPGSFTSIAASHRELVVMRHEGHLSVTLRAPETCATTVSCAIEAAWFGIVLAHGAYLPHLPDSVHRDSMVALPGATDRAFWLQGAAWEYPTFDNADTFVARLVREGLLVRDPLVAAALHERPRAALSRTAQRRFLRATGLPRATILQIERARHAAILLREGTPILETVLRAGYADQAHLTRALKLLIGQTPARLLRPDLDHSLSFLFKTTAQPDAMLLPGPADSLGGRGGGEGWRG